MDRGFVFKQINNYINCFMPGDPKVHETVTKSIYYTLGCATNVFLTRGVLSII